MNTPTAEKAFGITNAWVEEVERLTAEIAELKSLVDGVMEIVEIFPGETVAQQSWRKLWIERARKALEASHADRQA